MNEKFIFGLLKLFFICILVYFFNLLFRYGDLSLTYMMIILFSILIVEIWDLNNKIIAEVNEE
jgi:hypothetical protein